jgi:hypothetical protein
MSYIYYNEDLKTLPNIEPEIAKPKEEAIVCQLCFKSLDQVSILRAFTSE